jgi:hypothetical protein
MQPFEPLALAGIVKANAHIPNAIATSRFMFISCREWDRGTRNGHPFAPHHQLGPIVAWNNSGKMKRNYQQMPASRVP